MTLRNNPPTISSSTFEELKRLILKAVAAKPEHHHLKEGNIRIVKRKMSQIGG
jgi:molybdenum cofactor biosynthesis enzyme MoaA